MNTNWRVRGMRLADLEQHGGMLYIHALRELREEVDRILAGREESKPEIPDTKPAGHISEDWRTGA